MWGGSLPPKMHQKTPMRAPGHLETTMIPILGSHFAFVGSQSLPVCAKQGPKCQRGRSSGVGGMGEAPLNPPRQGSARRQRRVRSFCPWQNAKLTSCLYAMTTALRNQAFMTKVTTTYRGALYSLNAMPLRGEGDPGEPYPLNNSPFPDGPGSHYLRKVMFSLEFVSLSTGRPPPGSRNRCFPGSRFSYSLIHD